MSIQNNAAGAGAHSGTGEVVRATRDNHIIPLSAPEELEELAKQAMLLTDSEMGRDEEKQLLFNATKICCANSEMALESYVDHLLKVLKKQTGTGIATNRKLMKMVKGDILEDKAKKKIERLRSPGRLSPVRLPTIPAILQPDHYEHFYPDKAKDEGGKFRPLPTAQNWNALLEQTDVSLRYNLMTRAIEVFDGGVYGFDSNKLNQAYTFIKDGGSRNGLTKGGADALLDAIAGELCYHPFKVYLRNAVWDGTDRLPDVVATVPNTNPAHFLKMLRKWMISAVAAVYGYPEHMPPRGVLVLTGDQHFHKTSFFQALTPPGMFKRGASLNLGKPNEKDYIIKATKKMIVELGELDGTLSLSHVAAIKSYLDLYEDEYRLPYDRHEHSHPRMNVYCGTVNDVEFLRDESNTRFWVTEVTDYIATEVLEKMDLLQIWAQMKHEYDAWNGEGYNAPWLMSSAEVEALEIENERFKEHSPAEELLRRAFYWDSPEYLKAAGGDVAMMTESELAVFSFMTASEVAEHLGYDPRNQRHCRAVGKALKSVTGKPLPTPWRAPNSVGAERRWTLPAKRPTFHNGKVIFDETSS